MDGDQDDFETLLVPPSQPCIVPAADQTLYVPPDDGCIAIQGDDNVIVIRS